MRFFSRLFGNEIPDPTPVKSADSPIRSVTHSHSLDILYLSNQDILEGFEFCATLQIRTPLDVLIHHGEIYKGPPSLAPRYGEWENGISPDGIWVLKTKSWEQLATRDKDLAAALDCGESVTHPSDIGPVHPYDYLPFLIEFRKIVESTLSIEKQIVAIEDLKFVSIPFASAISKLSDFYPPFPSSFYIKQLCVIPGVGPKTAAALFRAGYQSIPHLKVATLESLVSIQGVGPNTAKKILDFSSTI